ncbi:MAG: hypothetical protein MJ151_02930 [Lachnospiraceae bacterium]|nr:hypothetical protein [Lachnospiraceae bacterium]
MPDMHTEMLLMQYDELKDTYVKLKEVVDHILYDVVVVKNHMFVTGIESRVKTRDSLEGKLKKKGGKYDSIADITDLVGARVITFYEDEVDVVATLIEQNFDVDYENSVDKRKLYEVDRFGYMSLHYICKIKKEKFSDENYPKLNDVKFEIQIRTALQHVWATIFHDTGYKSDVEVPSQYIRRLSRLSGLLELADGEFREIRSEIDAYRRNMRQLISKGDFSNVSYNMDTFRDYLAINPFKTIINNVAAMKHAEVVDDNVEIFYEVFMKCGIKNLNDIENMKKQCGDEAIRLCLAQMQGYDLDIFAQTMVLRNLCIIYILKNGGGEKNIKEMYDVLNGERNENASLAKKAIEQAMPIINMK